MIRNSKLKILIITPVNHIKGVADKLKDIGSTTFIDDPFESDIQEIIPNYDIIFTNPNKSKIFLGKRLLKAAKNLKIICTASTGTNHIDIDYASSNGIRVLSLTKEKHVIDKISSTAEHAFALTLASLRNITTSYYDTMKGNWNYEKFIGRQMDSLTVGVVGYGRLGKFYSKYCITFGSRVLVYDPYVKISKNGVEQIKNSSELITQSDIISIHVHVTETTKNMINKDWFSLMKKDVLIINTSRGEIINEKDLVLFLKENKEARIATDVISDEIKNRKNNLLMKYAKSSSQVLITPHIGGMTKEAQEIAYNHAVDLIKRYIKNNLELYK